MSIIGMIFAFLSITGIALLLCCILNYRLCEGVFVSSAFIIILLYLTGKFANTSGMVLLLNAAALFGYVFFAVKSIKNRRICTAESFSVTYFFLVGAFITGLIIIQGDFIQHIDELHQWAAAVKYMLAHNYLPRQNDFIDSGQMRATTVFYYFFLKQSGYDEGLMYVSATILIWIGFLLPLYKSTFSDFRHLAEYMVFIILIIFSMYFYGIKNLYVDVPLIAWSSGLMGWWINRDTERKLPNIILSVSGLSVIFLMKNMIGAIMVAALLMFGLLYYMTEKNPEGLRKKYITILLGVFSGLGILSAFIVTFLVHIALNSPTILPKTFQTMITLAEFSYQKVEATLTAYINFLWSGNLGNQSGLKSSFAVAFAIFAVLIYLYGEIYSKRRERIVFLLYGLFIVYMYLLVLFCAFIFLFSKLESIQVRGASRYLSIIGIYLIMLGIYLLMKNTKKKQKRISEGILLCMILFLSLGLSKKLIIENTALDQADIKMYKPLTDTKMEVSEIQDVLGPEDRVYLINQDEFYEGSEYVISSAVYYLTNQVSNPLVEPWRFIPEGCYIRTALTTNVSILNLPDYLKQGGYTYLWIYGADDYLSMTLPYVFPSCESLISDGQLYKVIYTKQGEIKDIRLEKILYSKDSR